MKRIGFTHESTHNESKEWYTPPEIFRALDMRFDLDPASPGATVVPWVPAERHLTVVENGLQTEWRGSVWLNPPYGMDTEIWSSRFARHRNGIMLVFARTDTVWFHKYAVTADAMLFIRGRVKFVRADGFCGGGCGAASMMWAFGEQNVSALRRCGERKEGFFVDLRAAGCGEDTAKIKGVLSEPILPLSF